MDWGFDGEGFEKSGLGEEKGRIGGGVWGTSALADIGDLDKFAGDRVFEVGDCLICI